MDQLQWYHKPACMGPFKGKKWNIEYLSECVKMEEYKSMIYDIYIILWNTVCNFIIAELLHTNPTKAKITCGKKF